MEWPVESSWCAGSEAGWPQSRTSRLDCNPQLRVHVGPLRTAEQNDTRFGLNTGFWLRPSFGVLPIRGTPPFPPEGRPAKDTTTSLRWHHSDSRLQVDTITERSARSETGPDEHLLVRPDVGVERAWRRSPICRSWRPLLRIGRGTSGVGRPGRLI